MSTPQPIPKALEGWVVLVVDDEEDSLDVARRLLIKAGASVAVAENGQEALNVLRQLRPDFIIADISMPVINGWDLMRTLNQDPRWSSIPVIALTAHAMRGDRERALAAGFVNHITKPLDAQKFIFELLAIIQESSIVRVSR